jgi:hypothetical protein
MARSTQDNSWEGVTRLAEAAGAKFPELAAAQWALESAWGKTPSGKHNHFGLKGPGTAKPTMEVIDGEEVPIVDSFLDFPSLRACVEYLVERWYKDWEGHKGVNRNRSREEAAWDLVKQGYATDPAYADKLIRLMKEHAVPAPVKQAAQVASSASKSVLRLRARQDTWLKKEPKEALELGEKGRSGMGQGRVLEVEQHKELAGDAHAWVKLGHGAGSWFIWGPHWQTVADAVAPVPPPAQVDWDDFACLVTPDLTVGEVLQYDARRKPRSGGDQRRIMATARQFQAIRTAWKYPLGVTSFYRPEPINKQVGGVPGSRHVTGEAVDLYPIGRSLDAFYQWLLPRWSGALGDGRRKGFIHLDTRGNGGFVPGGGVRPFVTWDY